jgi:hypothetical protein
MVEPDNYYMDPYANYYNQDRMPMVNHAPNMMVVDQNGYYMQSQPIASPRYYNSGPQVVDHRMSSGPYLGDGYVYANNDNNGIDMNDPYNGEYVDPSGNFGVDLNAPYKDPNVDGVVGAGVNQADNVANVKPFELKAGLFRADGDELDGEI